MRQPRPRGPLSTALHATLRDPPHDLPRRLYRLAGRHRASALTDPDAQITLFSLYELHYHGLDAVDDTWEWHPDLLRLRAILEQQLEHALRQLVGPQPSVPPEEVPAALGRLAATDNGPPLAQFLQHHATLAQFREFVAHRSVYHLKEADPHTWGIPRLTGRAKAALVEIQADEYGGGQAPRMHAELFRRMMRALGLDDTYGAYVDVVPAATLATSTVMSLFGLHRRWRAALLGHLAAIEMTSSLANGRYGNGLRRLGLEADATWFFDEHVEADAVHEQIAAHDLCASYAAEHPDTTGDILFGAACCLAGYELAAQELYDRWTAGPDRAGTAASA